MEVALEEVLWRTGLVEVALEEAALVDGFGENDRMQLQPGTEQMLQQKLQ